VRRLLIKATDDDTRFALSEDGVLVELFIEARADSGRGDGSWVGRVIVGRIKTILPGQIAFIDIGAKKNAFMNMRAGHGFKAGDSVLVRVDKDAVGTKGMAVGLEISLKGRFVVLYAHNAGAAESPCHLGVSRKIADEKEARRLRKIVRKNLPLGFGAIIRTNAQGESPDVIIEEITRLHRQLAGIIAHAEFIRPPTQLFPTGDEHAAKNLLSDILSDDLDEILIDAPDEFFLEMKSAICEILPAALGRISHEKISMKKQIRAALEKEVDLPCGGSITIEQTEACVVIDVNTGGNVGKIDYASAILETNLNAARAAAAQIRLRNLSGIILIDFIDMSAAAAKAAVLEAFATAVKKDRIRVEIEGFVGLGMLQLTRRKTRPPISAILQKPCEHCGGSGRERV